MDEEIPGYKFADSTELRFKRTMGAVQTSIIKFNMFALQCVDPSVSITSAKLYMKTTSTGPDGVQIACHRLIKGWNNSEVDWWMDVDKTGGSNQDIPDDVAGYGARTNIKRFWDLEGAHNHSHGGGGDHDEEEEDRKTPTAANTWYEVIIYL